MMRIDPPSWPRRARRIGPLVLLTMLAMLLAACSSANGEGSGDDGAAEASIDENRDVDDSGLSACADSIGTFYEGKEIEILVPFAAGGGTDVQARFFAPYLREAIPGVESLQVFNVPGSDGTIGNNTWITHRDHEAATSVLFSSGGTFFPWVFMEPTLELDYRDLVGTMAVPSGQVFYARADLGIETAADLATTDEQLIVGEPAASGLASAFLLAFDMLDIGHEVILGYEGRGPARVAFEQGEINVNSDSTSGFLAAGQALVDAGEAVPLFTSGWVKDGELIRDPAWPDLPHFGEVYEEIHGEAPSGIELESYKAIVASGLTLQKVMWLHNDAPQEAVDALTAAFECLASDPGFAAEAEEVLGGYEPVVGSAVGAAVESMLDFPDEQRDFMITYLVENYDYPDPR